MSGRVVVTGMGCVSSIGAGVEEFTEALFAGKSGLTTSTLATTGDGKETLAFEIQGFRPQKWLGPKGIRVLDRSARLICVSAHMALQDSDLLLDEGGTKDPSVGLVCGTMFGSVHSIASFDWSSLEDGVKYVNPMLFPNTVINSPAGQAAIKHNLQGVNSTIAAGMVSGLYAIHYAAEFIRLGRNHTLLAGGVEELCQESYLGLHKNGFLSARSKVEPFGSQRDGTVQGEGTALWVLEAEEKARERGVKPLMEICGFGSAHDAHSVSAYQVRGVGAARAIESAIRAAGISPEEIGLIVANASGSRAADRMEANALSKAFGSLLGRIPICAPKASFGEALGASGALQALAAAAALRRGEVPPTAGFSGAEDDLLLSADVQELTGEYALVNSFGCDGNNTALVVKACA